MVMVILIGTDVPEQFRVFIDTIRRLPADAAPPYAELEALLTSLLPDHTLEEQACDWHILSGPLRKQSLHASEMEASK